GMRSGRDCRRFWFRCLAAGPGRPSAPARRSSDRLLGTGFGLARGFVAEQFDTFAQGVLEILRHTVGMFVGVFVEGVEQRLTLVRSEEHTSELQSREKLVCRLLLAKKKGASDR